MSEGITSVFVPRANIHVPVTGKELARELHVTPFHLTGCLMEMNIFQGIHEEIPPDVAVKLCHLHGFNVFFD